MTTHGTDPRRLCRRDFIQASLAAAGGLLAAATSPEPDTAAADETLRGARKDGGRPNVIYIVTDDSGRQFGCYGSSCPTPNIDRLAREGITFTGAYAAAVCCSPSRGCFYTGKYAHTNGLIGLVNQGWALPEDNTTIVDCLNDAGYETVLIGKQHELPHRAPGTPHGYDRAFATRYNKDPDKCRTRADRVIDAALEYLRSRTQDAPPFFLYLATKEIHSPVHWPIYRPYRLDPEDVQLPGFLPDDPAVRRSFSWQFACQRFLDHHIGRLLDALTQLHLDENTFIVFTTDQGVSARRAKGTLYEAGTGVALVMRYPGVIAPGSTSNELVSNIDLMPTILDAANAGIPANVHGHSLMPLLSGAQYTPRTYLFTERNFHDDFKPTRSVRDERYKLILNFAAGTDRPRVSELTGLEDWHDFMFRTVDRPMPFEELYDLHDDPWETTNLAEREDFAPVLDRLRDALYQWMRQTGDFLAGATQQIHDPHKDVQLLGR